MFRQGLKHVTVTVTATATATNGLLAAAPNRLHNIWTLAHGLKGCSRCHPIVGGLQQQSQLIQIVLCMQWAATLTQNGANLPFVSPLKADKLPGGFQVNFDGQLTAVTALVQSGSNISPSVVVPPGESPSCVKSILYHAQHHGRAQCRCAESVKLSGFHPC